MGTLRWRIGSRQRKETIVDGIRMSDASTNRDRMRPIGTDGLRLVESGSSNIGGGSGFNTDGIYIGTHESVDAFTLLADDFTRNYQVNGGGSWYNYTADDVASFLGPDNLANQTGYYHPGVMHWRGTISNGRPSPTPTNAVVNLGNGRWCATSGPVGMAPNTETANMADHTLKVATNELWVRFYTLMSSDYVVGAEKMLTINATTAGNGGISIGGAGSGGGTGAAWTICPYYDCNVTGEIYYYRQNMNLPLDITTPNVWQFVEMHIKMNTPGGDDGIYELWLNNCGSGVRPVNPSGSPTQVAGHYGVQWQGPTQNNLIRSLWFENWSNPVSTGSYRYIDLINVNSNHALGFSAIA